MNQTYIGPSRDICMGFCYNLEDWFKASYWPYSNCTNPGSAQNSKLWDWPISWNLAHLLPAGTNRTTMRLHVATGATMITDHPKIRAFPTRKDVPNWTIIKTVTPASLLIKQLLCKQLQQHLCPKQEGRFLVAPRTTFWLLILQVRFPTYQSKPVQFTYKMVQALLWAGFQWFCWQHVWILLYWNLSLLCLKTWFP